MGKIIFYMFVLILVYLLIVYYKGTSSVAGTIGGQLQNIVLYLQGRNSAGKVADYPQQF